MRRTTLGLDDDLFKRLKRRAADEGTTMQAVANELLRQALAVPRRSKYELKLKGWSGALQPGIDLTDRDKLMDITGVVP